MNEDSYTIFISIPLVQKNAPRFCGEIRMEHDIVSLCAHRAVTLKRPVSFSPSFADILTVIISQEILL